tara:strand:+ start:103 stop:546 length:444 start_codon:yes stop_codon:yes gene_type:complete
MFSAESDDGSRIIIDGDVIVDNWGIHGRKRREHLIELNEGFHNIQVDHYHHDGPESFLNINYRGDDTDDKEVRVGDHMFHGSTTATVVNPPETVASSESNPVGSSTTNINKNEIGNVSKTAVIAGFLKSGNGTGPNEGSGSLGPDLN